MSSLARIFRTTSSSVSKSPIAKNVADNLPKQRKNFSDNLYKERDLRVVVEKFKKLSESGQFRRQYKLYGDIVHRLASAKKFKWVEDIIEEQKKYNDISHEGFSARLISLYGKSGMFDHASKLFDEMPERECLRTIKSFNALLGACVHSKRFDKAYDLFMELPGKLSVKPNVRSYNTVIKAVCEMGSVDTAVSLFDEIEKNGLEPDKITFNTLLDGLYGKGRFLDGDKFWAKMTDKNISPDIRTYNARLNGLVSEKKMAEAVQIFGELGTEGIEPNEFSYHHLIKGYCMEGDSEEAKRWYAELLKSDSAPIAATFVTLIQFACKIADFDWAAELCKETFCQKYVIDAKILQVTVDGLVAESRIEEAKQLVETANSRKSRHNPVIMPSDE